MTPFMIELQWFIFIPFSFDSSSDSSLNSFDDSSLDSPPDSSQESSSDPSSEMLDSSEN